MNTSTFFSSFFVEMYEAVRGENKKKGKKGDLIEFYRCCGDDVVKIHLIVYRIHRDIDKVGKRT